MFPLSTKSTVGKLIKEQTQTIDGTACSQTFIPAN